MHFCFSSMSYNLIRNFWCVAGYLNIKIFRWSHWISHPCEIPWDVSCCLSVTPPPPPPPPLSPLPCISFCVFWTPALTHCFWTLDTKELSWYLWDPNGWQCAHTYEHRVDLIWWKKKGYAHYRAWYWKMITLGFSPDSGKTRGGGCGMILTSCHHVEVRLDSFCLLNSANSATCWLWLCVYTTCAHV